MPICMIQELFGFERLKSWGRIYLKAVFDPKNPLFGPYTHMEDWYALLITGQDNEILTSICVDQVLFGFKRLVSWSKISSAKYYLQCK